MILATSQVANTVANLKSRYYKYLESLCSANGIDIGTLKSNGSDYEELEMFFGGLPVLIGLKYFEKLKILKLFGQDILNLKPLVEVGTTLEELWICEGPLKDLTGIENCKKLRKIYLFDSQIEDGTLLGKLTELDTLWIQNNKLKNFGFLDNLQQLTVLYLGGKQFDDHGAMSVQNWPHKLQEFDCNANSIKSLQSLLPLASCEVVRCLNLASDNQGLQLCTEQHFSWIGFHFPYLERLNNDTVGDKFQQTQIILAEGILMDSYVALVNSEKNYNTKITSIERSCQKIQEKLALLVTNLSKLALTVPKKEGRRELVIRMQEQSQKSLKALKTVKRQCLALEFCLHRLRDYYFPTWRLEGALGSVWPRELDESEIRLLEHSFKWFGSKSTEYTVKIHVAFCFEESNQKQLKKTDFEKLFFLDFDRRSVLWDLRSIVGLCDRRFTKDYREDAVRIFKDISIFVNEAKEGTRFFVLPLVKCEKHYKKFKMSSKYEELEESEKKNEEVEEIEDGEQFANKGQIESANWKELGLFLICLVEVQPVGQVLFDDLRNLPLFDEKFAAQVKKLKNLGIDLKLEKLQTNTVINESTTMESQINDLTEDQTMEKKQKIKKVEEVITSDFPKDRWRRQLRFSGNRKLTLRDPLELALTFAKAPIFVDSVDLITTVTCLDLSSMKLTKLDGIEQMTNLVCLSIAKNKLTSVKKLKQLKNLHFLDMSENHICHFDEPPEMLSEVNLSGNQLTGLQFCSKLQLLTKINITNNKIKSLRGIENSKLLEILRIGFNQIKDKSELDFLNAFPKLTVLDLSNNAINEIEGYRKIILQKCPALLLIDCEIVPKEERQLASRKPGKALTIDFIEKHFPNFEFSKTLNLQGNGFQMIAFDRQGIMRLQHLTEIDLSNNSLENLHELVELENLEIFNLSQNSVMTLTGVPVTQESQAVTTVNGLIGEPRAKILPCLKELDLSFNNLTHQTLSRLGLSLLPSLKKLVLIGNQLTKLDLSLFDLKYLTEIDVSKNEIKIIRKKTLIQLKWLNLAENKLKDLEGLSTPNLVYLDVRNNKIVTCSALKPISQMSSLKKFFCSGNTVTERRVYHDFIRNQVKSLEFHDEETIPNMTSDAHTVIQSGPEREISSISNGSVGSSTGSCSQLQYKNETKIAQKNGIRIASQNSSWKPAPVKEVPKSTGRPVFCPPGSNIVVNQRISQSRSCFTFFPEGHYLSEDGTLSSTPSWSPVRTSYGCLPQLHPSKNNPKRELSNLSKISENSTKSSKIQQDPFLINGERAMKHLR